MSNETSGAPGAPPANFKLIGLMVCFVLNSSLLIFTTIKLLRKVKENENQPKGQNRKVIFFFISLALLCRCLYEAYKISCSLKAVQPPKNFNILLLLDNLPTVFLLTLASSFSVYWHRRYSSFEGYEIGRKKANKYKTFVVFFNILFYLVFLLELTTVLHCDQFEIANTRMTLVYGSFAFDLLLVTLALYITGKKLFNRTTRFITYTGRSIKSAKGFQCNFYLLLICCLIKCAQQSIFFYSQLEHKMPFYLSNDFVYYNLFVLLFYIGGETGVFLCLIILLDARATKCEGLLDQEETSAKIAVSSNSEVSIYCSGSLNNSTRIGTPSTHL